ncbi:MAG TPA: ABC transporter ATP-binding protein [Acidimicrobiales bacterium]|nr:ABC transporter ATP-binding protein [Acidimicrobiales bacterium]
MALQMNGERSEAATGHVGSAIEETADGTPLLVVDELRVRFTQGGRHVYAVEGVSYSLRAGRSLAIIGESGSGKTVSCRAVMGLLPPSARVSGSVRLEGNELVGLREKELCGYRGTSVSMVFQDPSRSLNPTMRIGPQIAEALTAHLKLRRAEARDRAVELLERVRVPAAARRYHDYPHQLSGGMRQRVMIAIALACDPKLLIADEATTALDVTTQAQIMELLAELREQTGMALLLVSHDLSLAASYVDEVIVMYGGRVVEQASTRELFADVKMPYTQALLEAIPRFDRPSHLLLPVVEGRPPDLASLPTGCAFAPRCHRADDQCREQTPTLSGPEGTHRFACWHPCGEPVATR